MTKQNKKRSKFPLFMLLILIIVALGLLWKFGYLKGFGRGEGQANSTSNHSTESVASEPQEAGRGQITIEVSGDTYLWNGTETDLNTIKENLIALNGQPQIILVDHQAIQNAYQEVLDLLNEEGLPFDQVNQAAE